VTGKTLLIGYGTLISKMFSESFRHIKLLGGFLIGMIVMMIVFGLIFGAVGGLLFVSPALAAIVFAIAYVGVILLGTIVGFAYLRALLKRHEGIGFWRNFGWGVKHFWQLGLVALLMQMILSGGMLLLIVPGIVVMVYLMFTYHAYAENEVGIFKSVLRSTQLVAGQWWSVLGRFILLFVATMSVFAVLGIVSALGAMPGGFVLILFPVLFICLLLPTLHIFAYGLVLIYESARDARPLTTFAPETQTVTKFVYIGLLVIGVGLTCFQLFVAYQSFSEMRVFFDAMNADSMTPELEQEMRLRGMEMELDSAARQFSN